MKKIFMILWCLYSCSTASNKMIDNSTIVDFTSQVERGMLDTFFKSSKIILLETNENSLLKGITRICSHDNKLFVFDEALSKLVVFNMDGGYLTHIHSVGGGPKEYMSVIDFCLDTLRKHILLLCDRPYKIMKYSYTGKFVLEKKIKELYRSISTDSHFIYCTKSEHDVPSKSYSIACLDSNINVVRELLPSIQHVTNNTYLAGQALTNTLNTYYVRRFDNTIYQLNEGEIGKRYTINFKEHALPERILKNINEVDIYKVFKENKYVFSLVNVVESANHLMFKTNLANFVLNKKNNTLIAFQVIMNSKLWMGNSDYFPIGNSGHLIASTIESSAIDRIRQSRSQAKEEDVKKEMAERPELEKLLKTVQIDDNPVLLLYELK